MHARQSALAALVAISAVTGWVLVGTGQGTPQLPLGPTKERGASVTGAFEGWYKTPDGGFALLVGYFNRNRSQSLDIPIGPNNRIEPGGPDFGQPTYFLPRRQWGVFSIPVPNDFATKKLTWTLTANGETTQIPLTLTPAYEVEPYKEAGMGNTPPVLRFAPNGPAFTGPPRATALALTATVAEPATLTFWATDDGHVEPGGRGRGGPPVTVTVAKHRGPGGVTFGNPRPDVAKEDGEVSTTAKFDAPGDYVIRVQANDSSGEGGSGFQCCWTNAHVKVTVK
jgi:hypothetical protein